MEESSDQQHIFAQLSSQVARSSQRLVRLENDATESEVQVKRSSLGQDDAYASLDMQFSFVGDELGRLRDAIDEFTKTSGRVMLRFRELVKKDQLAETQMRLDEWPLESFITRKEFSSLLKRKLRERP